MPTESLDRRNTQAEETNTEAAKQTRSKLVTIGMPLNFSKTPTWSIIMMACPIFDFACEIDFISTQAGSVWRKNDVKMFEGFSSWYMCKKVGLILLEVRELWSNPK